ALAAAREAVYPKNVPAGTCAPGVSQETPTMAQQQADALALVAETTLHHGIDPGAPGERYQVVVHVDAEVLADADQAGQSVLEDGARVPAGTSQRLACDASRVVMRHGQDGRTASFGSAARTGGSYPRSRFLPRCPTIPCKPSERGTMRRGSSCMRGRRHRVGWGSVWTWAGRRLASPGALNARSRGVRAS